jgi:uncharacterized DUF497 family protein
LPLNYEWDEVKYELNFIKHGIRFEDAVEVFGDYNAIEMIDNESGEEERIVMIGFNSVKGVLVVVYCEKSEDTIRIISAREATKTEESEYESRI